ncbi:hypothetical protein BKI52_30215 [marine bacterium AO1-C]|nr:hypothetical protein BKI52_30215 [marine bacterium AO1-C]
MWKLFSILVIKKRAFPKSNSIEDAGKALTNIVLEKTTLPKGKNYAALQAGKMPFSSPAKLAQNIEVMEKAWNDSMKILNLEVE